MTEQDPKSKPAIQQDSTKATIESILIALILAFIFRAYVVEAFVIPTGSMAPTLLGTHLRVDDPQTGYTFTVNPPRQGAAGQTVNRLAYDETVICPMSQNPVTLEADRITRSGDRILVQKYIYALNEPERWDVVVFKAPHVPQINYIKRLVALPNESVHLFDGNVFVSHVPGGDWSTYQIARKTDPASNHNWERVQRAVWQPVYHSQYLPLDVEAAREGGWSMPWKAMAGDWDIDGRRSYVFQRGESDDVGSIRFDFTTMGSRSRFADMMYPYNQLMQRSGTLTPIEDVRLSVGVELRDQAVELALQTTARLGGDFPFEQLIARIATDGAVSLEARAMGDQSGAVRTLASTQARVLEAGRTTDVELWYVDQEALVFIDGEVVLRYEVKLNLQQMSRLPPPQMLPLVGIDVDQDVTLHRIELDRDLYYLSDGDVRGGLMRDAGGVDGNPAVQLLDDEFFVLGDNSPQSQDSRLWPWQSSELWNQREVRPGLLMTELNPHFLIERLYFDADGRDHAGIVPRGLLIGRAFFVYFPAPQRFGPQLDLPVVGNIIIPIPNFGDMRFIW